LQGTLLKCEVGLPSRGGGWRSSTLGKMLGSFS
jgi:hypothetical protein